MSNSSYAMSNSPSDCVKFVWSKTEFYHKNNEEELHCWALRKCNERELESFPNLFSFFWTLVALMNSVHQKYKISNDFFLSVAAFTGQLTCISIDIQNLFFICCFREDKNAFAQTHIDDQKQQKSHKSWFAKTNEMHCGLANKISFHSL